MKMFDVKYLRDGFVAEITGLNLMESLSPENQARVKQLFDDAGVLIFRGQRDVTKQGLRDAAKMLGELDYHPVVKQRDREVPELVILAANGVFNEVEHEDEEKVVGYQL